MSTVLIVDDNADNLFVLGEILKRGGYKLVSADNGETALGLVAQEQPDIILLDIRMPVMDGFEVCRNLKTDPDTRDIPVIFISALDDVKDKIEAFSEGAVDYIVKPFSRAEVLARVKMHLGMRQLQVQIQEQNLKLRMEVEERKRANHALHDANTNMERRVEERTGELSRVNEQLKQLSAHLESVREDEKVSIARELHDELGVTLTALNMDLAWLQKRLPDDPGLEAKTQSMSELIASAAQTTRRIVTELRPSILDDLGLAAAIEWQLQEFGKHAGIQCALYVGDDELSIDADRSIALFRILQETLTNVSRHAKAETLEVSLQSEDGNVILEIIDDGIGIGDQAETKPTSHGIRGMKERVRYLDGDFNISRGAQGGTVTNVCMPAVKPEEGV